MTYYNPNIQRVFEIDDSVDLFLQALRVSKPTLATYFFMYDYKYSLSCCSNFLNFPSLLNSLHFQHKIQYTNLFNLGSGFSTLFIDLVLSTYRLHLNSFSEYICYLKSLDNIYSEHDILYINECIIDFIELLFFADIASKDTIPLSIDFSKSPFNSINPGLLPLNFLLNDRLKLYAGLYANIRFQVCDVTVCQSSATISFDFRIGI